MIDLLQETRLTTREVAAATGHHVKTVREWYTHGVQGVKLESLKIGWHRYTSAEALQRFVERLTAIGQQAEPVLYRTPSRHRREALAALAELQRRGAG